jgi:hypothetical protein
MMIYGGDLQNLGGSARRAVILKGAFQIADGRTKIRQPDGGLPGVRRLPSTSSGGQTGTRAISTNILHFLARVPVV